MTVQYSKKMAGIIVFNYFNEYGRICKPHKQQDYLNFLYIDFDYIFLKTKNREC